MAVLCDISDKNWVHSCRHILEFFSTLWGGYGNVIIPTDGKTIQPLFWNILETFSPDYLVEYRTTLRDLEIRDPNAFEEILERQLKSWSDKFGSAPEYAIHDIRKNLRRATTTTFSIDPQLQQQLKARLAPFFFEQFIVQAGFLSAGSVAAYPFTNVFELLSDTDHPKQIVLPSPGLGENELLWHAANLGTYNEERTSLLINAGIEPIYVGKNPSNGDELEQQRKIIKFAMHRESDSAEGALYITNGGSPLPEPISATAASLSLLNLGGYRHVRSSSWTMKSLAIAGNTISDFCLYFALSRMRERVFWIYPSITNNALSDSLLEADFVGPEYTFANALHDVSEYTTQYLNGLDIASATLNVEQLSMVSAGLGRVAGYVFNISDVTSTSDAIPSYPLQYYERTNGPAPRVIQVADEGIIELFETPKPKTFRRVSPANHRWITELELRAHQLPCHPALGSWLIGSFTSSTGETRASRNGLAYFCPNTMVFSQDIDAVVVRPTIHIPTTKQIFEKLAACAKITCSTSDKGFYAQNTIEKFGGLAEASQFMRSPSGQALIAAYRNKSKPQNGEHDQGVLLDDRRFLDFVALKKVVGDADMALEYIDEFSRKGIFYRGFIFQCEFCRYSAWFPVKDITDHFTCTRCHREQVYTSRHWKYPKQPSWYYQLDEVIYQGFANDMHVPILMLDCLRSRAQDSFLYVEELEYRKMSEDRPFIECDLNCVVDGVLTLGEGKTANRLDSSRAKERTILANYKQLAIDLGARRVVFGTEADTWDGATTQLIDEAFRDVPTKVNFLTWHNLYNS